jgi:hypothetical protein
MYFHTLGIVATVSYKFLLMILAQEANSCRHQCYAARGDGNPALHEEMFPFLTQILKMGHDQHDILKDGPQPT